MPLPRYKWGLGQNIMRLKERGEIIDMNKKTKKIITGLCGAIIGFLAAISLWYDWKENGNCVTVISGLWSAAATAVLGGIAYWQNKKYKQLADQQNDVAFMPDLCISTALMDKAFDFASAWVYSVQGCINDIKTILCNPIKLWLLKGPIINLKVTKICHENECWECSKNSEMSFANESKPIYLFLYIPEKYALEGNRFVAALEYENVYGTKYKKEIVFTVKADNRTLNVQSLKRARRVEDGQAENADRQ